MIRLRFWGTRGGIVSPGPRRLRYGGNTLCVEVVGYDGREPGAAARLDNPRLILDGGTGLAGLQEVLMAGPWGEGQGDLTFLLSHYHWDHLIGLAMPFKPIIIRGNRLVFYGSSAQEVRASIERLFASVYSPIKQSLLAQLAYRTLDLSGTDIAGFHVRAAENWHPGGALSFRIEYGACAVVYSTDHGIGQSPAVDARLVELAQGADVWILDAYHTVEEKSQRVLYGHSSHLEAVQLALRAGVQMAVLFHHDAAHDDDLLDRMGQEAAEAAAGSDMEVLMARDGMVVDVDAKGVQGRAGTFEPKSGIIE
jgi:ribonuclease BN (tRNA processing enzyme)